MKVQSYKILFAASKFEQPSVPSSAQTSWLSRPAVLDEFDFFPTKIKLFLSNQGHDVSRVVQRL